MIKVVFEFEPGDTVCIDGDRSIRAVVVASMIRGRQGEVTHQVSWIQNGSIHEPWIEDWRLTRWDA